MSPTTSGNISPNGYPDAEWAAAEGPRDEPRCSEGKTHKSPFPRSAREARLLTPAPAPRRHRSRQKGLRADLLRVHGAQGEGGFGRNLQLSKRDLAAVIAYIKSPTGSMPKLYPSPLSDADVASVAATS